MKPPQIDVFPAPERLKDRDSASIAPQTAIPAGIDDHRGLEAHRQPPDLRQSRRSARSWLSGTNRSGWIRRHTTGSSAEWFIMDSGSTDGTLDYLPRRRMSMHFRQPAAMA
jgi:hypothetical protein